ncbi:MAG: acyltransferase [Myxococcaceae bacterium]|nr:acyltransferase [Myxococcaceae bacterium]
MRDVTAPNIEHPRDRRDIAAPAAPITRIHELDGLRGVLALYVAAYHLMDVTSGVANYARSHLTLLCQGWYAVDVFFLMSGFVMMHVYGETFSRPLDGSELRFFFLSRIARLYPVHLAVMLVFAIGMSPLFVLHPDLLAPGERYSWPAWLASLVMVHGPWIATRTWNFPSWSVSAEWHAYLLFPLLVAPLRRVSATLAAVGLYGCVAITYALYSTYASGDDAPTNGALSLLRVLPLFIAGMFTRQIHLSFKRLHEGDAFTSFVLLLTLGVLCTRAYAHIAVLMIPSLTICALHNHRLRTLLSRPALLRLGTISYSLYMTHIMIGVFALSPGIRLADKLTAFDFGKHPMASAALLAAAVLASVALGSLTCARVEAPSRKWIQARLQRPQRALSSRQAVSDS